MELEDTENPYGGNRSAVLIGNKNVEFCTLERGLIDAEYYQGKRIRIQGFMKRENVEEGSGLFITAYSNREKVSSVGFDVQDHNERRGTSRWESISLMIDVPDNANDIVFGGWIDGNGKIWLDDFEIEVLDPEPLISELQFHYLGK